MFSQPGEHDSRSSRAAATLHGVAAAEPFVEPSDISRGPLVISYRHGGRDSTVRRVLALADVVAVLIGLLALAVPFDHAHPGRLFAWGLATIPAWLLVFRAYGLYDRDVRRINHSAVDDVPAIFHALLLGCVLTWLYYGLLPSNGVIFAELATFAVVTGAGLLALRTIARHQLHKRLGSERLLLIAPSAKSNLLAAKLAAHPEYHATAVGVVNPAEADVRRLVADLNADRVVVSQGDVEVDEMLDIIRTCRELRVKVSVLPQLFDAMGSSVEIDDIEGMLLLDLVPPVLSRSAAALKRAMDIVGAGILLLLTAPIQLAIVVAIKLDDGGPVLFRQRRIGRWDQRFEVLKFRTMVVDAEAKRAELLSQSSDPGWLLLENDPRVTRVGRFLRHTSLDELPQAWNVLRGDMSLVGPRPLIEDEGLQLVGWRRTRVDLKPGVTGLWQVLGRVSIPFDEMIKLDYQYVTNWSLWSDIRLLLRTFPVVLRRRGVN